MSPSTAWAAAGFAGLRRRLSSTVGHTGNLGQIMRTRAGRTVRATVTTLSLLLTLSIPVVSLAVDARPAGEVRRVGLLSNSSPKSSVRFVDEFRQGLRELGWVEGRNLVIEYRWAEGKSDRLPALAAELVRLKMDVLVVGSSPAAMAAKNATGTIPIVLAGVADPVRQGLVTSLARPGGNVTGISWTAGTNKIGKELELLRDLLPKVRRVAILLNAASPNHATAVSNVKAAARSLGVQILLLEARGPNEFDVAFAAMAKDRVEALLIETDPMFILHRAQLADLTTKNRLPSMHAVRGHVEAGGLMSYGPSFPDLGRQAATFVDRIFKGPRPADLPVEQPTKFELFINLKAAKALGLTIPPSLLARADHIIE